MKPKPKLTLQWHPLRAIWRWLKTYEGQIIVIAIGLFVGLFSAMIAGPMIASENPGSWPLWKILAFTASEYVPLFLTILLGYTAVNAVRRHPPVKRVVKSKDREAYEKALQALQLVHDYEEGKL